MTIEISLESYTKLKKHGGKTITVEQEQLKAIYHIIQGLGCLMFIQIKQPDEKTAVSFALLTTTEDYIEAMGNYTRYVEDIRREAETALKLQQENGLIAEQKKKESMSSYPESRERIYSSGGMQE